MTEGSIYRNKEINAKLHNIDNKIDQQNKENNLLQSRLSLAENASKLLARNQHKNLGKRKNLQRYLHKMENYSRRECIEIAGIPLSITNEVLEERVVLIFSEISVNIDEIDIFACHRVGSTERTIVKLLNRKDAGKLLETKNKMKYLELY